MGIPGINTKDAKSAMSSFFDTDSPASAQEDNTGEVSPVDKVLKQVKQGATPPGPKGDITKVKGGNNKVSSLSVEDANTYVESKKTFKELLEQTDVSLAELFSVIDEYLQTGFCEKSYKIKSFEFILRSKKIYSVDAITDALDSAKYTMASAAGQMLMERNLAAELVYFKLGDKPPKVFKHDKDEDDEATLEFIRNELSAPIYSIMVNKLQRFDLIVGLSSRDEAIDYFLAHTQD